MSLQGIDHPAAETLRAAIEARLQARQRLRATPPPIEPKGTSDLILKVWESLLGSNPDAVAQAIAAQALSLVAEFPSAPLLEVALKVLEVGPRLDVPRIVLGQVAGRSAHIVTRYALAERLYRNAIADAEALDRPDLACQNLGTLAFLKMEQREWAEARALGERAVAMAERAEDPAILEGPLQNLAGILWHLEEFEASAERYRRAIAVSLPPKRIVPLANLAYLWGVFGVEPGLDFRPDLTLPTDGYRGLAESYLAFSCGMAEGDPVITTIAADRLLELTTASGMERLLAVAVDCAAMALVQQRRPVEAAACVRVGSRLRRDLDHLRSPGERLAIRRNVALPLFGQSVAEALASIPIDSPEKVGEALRVLLRR